jgi:hypothetical protein
MAMFRNALSASAPQIQHEGAKTRRRGYRIAAIQGSQLLFFAIVPTALVVAVFVGLFTEPLGHPPLFDYHGDIWLAGQRILHGANPYDVPQLARRLAAQEHGAHPDPNFALPVYPAPVLVLLAPMATLPYTGSAALFFIAAAAAAIAALYVAGVRDWRCYGAMFLAYPLMHGLVLGNVTPFLMLGTALAWRYRRGTYVIAAAVAAVVTLKLFLWPLLVWMIMIGRAKAALLSLTLCGLAFGLGWAALGFAGLTSYPHLLSLLSRVESHLAFSVFALLVSVGMSNYLAIGLSLGAAGALLGLGWALRGRPQGDRHTFALAVLAALVASPIVWSHYFALLYILLAIRRPRFSPVWLAPALLWPLHDPARSTAEIAVFLTLATLVCLVAVVDWPASWRPRREVALAP